MLVQRLTNPTALVRPVLAPQFAERALPEAPLRSVVQADAERDSLDPDALGLSARRQDTGALQLDRAQEAPVSTRAAPHAPLVERTQPRPEPPSSQPQASLFSPSVNEPGRAEEGRWRERSAQPPAETASTRSAPAEPPSSRESAGSQPPTLLVPAAPVVVAQGVAELEGSSRREARRAVPFPEVPPQERAPDAARPHSVVPSGQASAVQDGEAGAAPSQALLTPARAEAPTLPREVPRLAEVQAVLSAPVRDSAPSAQPLHAPAPEVRVRIGRVEVRSRTPAPQPTPFVARAPSAPPGFVTLNDYLKKESTR